MGSDERLEGVEARVAWLEKHLADLDAVVRELGDELQRMRVDLAQLQASQAGVGEGDPSGPRYEVPPHY